MSSGSLGGGGTGWTVDLAGEILPIVADGAKAMAPRVGDFFHHDDFRFLKPSGDSDDCTDTTDDRSSCELSDTRERKRRMEIGLPGDCGGESFPGDCGRETAASLLGGGVIASDEERSDGLVESDGEGPKRGGGGCWGVGRDASISLSVTCGRLVPWVKGVWEISSLGSWKEGAVEVPMVFADEEGGG